MFIYCGVQSLTSKRLILGGVSFRVISSPMNAPSGNGFIGSWDQNCWVQTKNGDFWPFLAFEGRFGGLKDPPEVRVEDKTCRTIHGTHLEGVLSQKNWTGLAGWVRNGQNRSESDFWPIPWKIQGLDKT